MFVFLGGVGGDVGGDEGKEDDEEEGWYDEGYEEDERVEGWYEYLESKGLIKK